MYFDVLDFNPWIEGNLKVGKAITLMAFYIQPCSLLTHSPYCCQLLF